MISIWKRRKRRKNGQWMQCPVPVQKRERGKSLRKRPYCYHPWKRLLKRLRKKLSLSKRMSRDARLLHQLSLHHLREDQSLLLRRSKPLLPRKALVLQSRQKKLLLNQLNDLRAQQMLLVKKLWLLPL